MWTTRIHNIKGEDLILMYTVYVSPLSLPLTRVTKVFTGEDGTVRVAQIQSSTCIFTRPVNKLVTLPCHGW